MMPTSKPLPRSIVHQQSLSLTLRIWGRLLWKEWRESWPILAIGVLLPVILIAALHSKRLAEQMQNVAYSGVALISIMVTLWAVNRVTSRQAGKVGARDVLPLTGIAQWIDTYLLALPVTVIAGFMLGLLVVTGKESKLHETLLLAVFCSLLANFFLATVLTKLLSPIPAIIAGVAWLFISYDENMMAQRSNLYLLLIAVLLIGIIPWEVLATKHRYMFARLSSIVLMVLLIVGWLFAMQFQQRKHTISLQETPQDRTLKTLMDENGNLINQKPNLSNAIHFIGEYTINDPEEQIDYLGHRGALYLQQTKGHMARLLVSPDGKFKNKREIVQLQLEADALSTHNAICLMSPDGHYLLIQLVPRVEFKQGVDFWLVNTIEHKATLVLPGVLGGYYGDGAIRIWEKHRLLLTAYKTLIVIDLNRMCATYTAIPPKEG